jgi:hypothetical protein
MDERADPDVEEEEEEEEAEEAGVGAGEEVVLGKGTVVLGKGTVRVVGGEGAAMMLIVRMCCKSSIATYRIEREGGQ